MYCYVASLVSQLACYTGIINTCYTSPLGYCIISTVVLKALFRLPAQFLAYPDCLIFRSGQQKKTCDFFKLDADPDINCTLPLLNGGLCAGKGTLRKKARHWKAKSTAFIVTDSYVLTTERHADRLMMSRHTNLI